MAKTIKFNLICDDKPVRTVEDLQNNFSIEDVLAYYNNRLLHRWLEVRGYAGELEKINGITAEKPLEIIKELIKIFNVASDDSKVEEGVYMLEFLEERQWLCSKYDKENYKTRNIIDDYQSGYKQLVDGILENPDDVARIKANIGEIVANYKWVLDMNHRDLFWILRDKSVLAVMCLLMNSQSRDYYLPVKKSFVEKVVDALTPLFYKIIAPTLSLTSTTISKCAEIKASETSVTSTTDNEYAEIKAAGTSVTSTTDNEYAEIKAVGTGVTSTTDNEYVEMSDDKAKMFQEICKLIQTADFKEKLGDSLVSFAGVTDGYWKDLEPKGKKYMIISMGYGDYVRSAGVSGGDLSSEDILNRFVIVDGIDYKSNSATRQLLYMEV